MLREAAKVKASFHSTLSSYIHLHHDIEKKAEWEWVKGGSKPRELVAAHNQLKESLNEWHQEYLCSADMKAITKKYSQDRVSVELKAFIAAKEKIDKLNQLVAKMFVAHEAMS